MRTSSSVYPASRLSTLRSVLAVPPAARWVRPALLSNQPRTTLGYTSAGTHKTFILPCRLPAAETAALAPSRCFVRRSPAIPSIANCGAGIGLRGTATPASSASLLGIRRRTFLALPPARRMNRAYPMAAAAAADNDPAAATHPPAFSKDLTLIEAEEEQLRETAWSLLHRQKVWGGERLRETAWSLLHRQKVGRDG